jgi:NADH-quinone oxidoreductase subunit J
VHSVLFLILTFVNAAGLFLLTGAEFLAMILLVVYVGAVAVLFLFVVMMLDVDFAELKQGALQYAPFGALIGLILAAELVIVLGGYDFRPSSPATCHPAARPAPQHGCPRRYPLHPTTSTSSRSRASCCWSP